MKIVLKGWVYAQQYSWSKPGEWKYSFFGGPKMNAGASENSTGYLALMPYEFEIDCPADWNPISLQVQLLEAEKSDSLAALVACQSSVASINARLSKLQELTNDSAAAAPDASA